MQQRKASMLGPGKGKQQTCLRRRDRVLATTWLLQLTHEICRANSCAGMRSCGPRSPGRVRECLRPSLGPLYTTATVHRQQCCRAYVPYRLESHRNLALAMIRSRESPSRVQTSKRVLATDDPVIVKTKQLMAGATDVISLAQGELTSRRAQSCCARASK